jgi:hypothetical protein
VSSPDAGFAQAVAGLSAAALRDLIAAAAGQLAAAPRPAVVSAEQAVELHGRGRMPYAVPQWTTTGPGGAIVARGVVIQALSYKERRQAEERATIRQGPRAGEVDDWRRVLEEAACGIVEPSGLDPRTVERWGYAVVVGIHAAIERLGDYPAALIAEELAVLAGGPPPPGPDDPPPGEPVGDPAALDSNT